MSNRTNNRNMGEVVTFFDLLNPAPTEKHPVLHLVIPKIQRDYAQGRPGQERLRKNFLDRIFTTIDAGDDSDNAGDDSAPAPQTLTLDFVYGRYNDLRDPESHLDDRTFLPIDGQQRLTTLFLLHLYVGKRGGKDTEFLRIFSYQTRDSSKQFCEKLIDIAPEHFSGIREYVENQWWFTRRWADDPTILSMLTMLQAIDAHYGEEADFGKIWKNLTERVNFWRLHLDDLETADDLYIKMNSRGKPLTDFEHFKAMLDMYAEKNGELARKIDTDWTNLLWRYRDAACDFNAEKYTDNELDDRFYLLTKFFLYLEGVKAGTEGISQRDNILDLAEKVLAEKSAAKKILARFERILDFFCHHEPEKFFADFLTNEYDLWFADSAQKPVVGSPVKVYVRKKRRSPSLDLLRLIFDENIDVTDLPLFEAFFEHAANPVLGTDELRERIRKVRNLVQNCHIQQRGLQADLLATDLLMQPVIDYDTDNRTGSEFVQAQKEQEIFKDNWIAENPGQADLLHALENHWMLEGNLDVVIIRDREGRLLDIDRRALCRFGHLIHFDVNGFNELWPVERALLAYGDYGQERENIRDYGGTTWHNWRDEITKNFNGDSHAVFRKLLASLSDFSAANLNAEGDRFVSECGQAGEYPWRYYLVKYREMADAPRGKYRIEEAPYLYLKANASGKGYGGEYFWNPYNLALRDKLQAEGYESSLAEDGGALTLLAGSKPLPGISELSIDFGNSRLQLEWGSGEGEQRCRRELEIPQKNGVDSADRVEWAHKIILDLLQEGNKLQDR